MHHQHPEATWLYKCRPSAQGDVTDPVSLEGPGALVGPVDAVDFDRPVDTVTQANLQTPMALLDGR